ncbi:MAG: RsmD family RNA methyltransferase, partial [Nitrospinota bacterium]
LFDILGSAVEGARVLDVFAGTGALSAEALSRGASSAVLLEKGRDALRVLRRNLEGAGFGRDLWEVLPGDALASLRRLRRGGRAFDLVFLDPPYASDLGEKALMEAAGLLEGDGTAILEHAARTAPPEVFPLEIVETRRFGDTAISLYQRRKA